MPAESVLPDIRITLNGRTLSRAQADDVIAVTVHEDLGALTMFTIELYNWNQHALEFTWSDDNSFLPGTEVDLALGFVDDLTEVLRRGEVTGLEPEFRHGQPARLLVRGFDKGHRLQRGRRTRSFVKTKDSDMATTVARDVGLQASVTATTVKHDHVFQHNQTDWDFLIDRASRIGYVVFVRDNKLHFGPAERGGQPSATLRLSQDVESFQPRLSARSQADQVFVRSWDVKGKKPIVARASVGQELIKVGEGTPGLNRAKSAFHPAQTTITDLGAIDAATAEKAAKAELTRGAMLHISGELTCRGRPEVHAGDTIRVEEAGRRFSGSYLVTGVTHVVEMATGFRTRLRLQRSAAP